MNFEYQSDDQIEADLYRDVRTELDVLPRILARLREVETRKIHSKHRFSSLEEYAVKKLGYTEDEAARRISAMRLLKELPQLEKKVEEGKLKLTHLVRARTVFRKEAKANRARTKEQKLSLLERLENTTLRQADKTLELEAFVDISKPKNELSLDQFDGRVRADLARLLELRGGRTLHDLIGELAALGLEKWDPVRKAERAKARAQIKPSSEVTDQTRSNDDTVQPAAPRANEKREPPRREHLHATKRHAVYLNGRGRCQNCGSGRNCQVDHIIPIARGGTDDLENLRLLCRSCNLRHAIDSFGFEKMRKHLKSPSADYRVAEARLGDPLAASLDEQADAPATISSWASHRRLRSRTARLRSRAHH